MTRPSSLYRYRRAVIAAALAAQGCSASVPASDAMPGKEQQGFVELAASELQRVAVIDIAFDGEAYVVVWNAYRGRDTDDAIVMARVSPAGEVVMPARVVLETGVQVTELEVLVTPGGYTLWYREKRWTGADITALSTAVDGAVITPPTKMGDIGQGFYDELAVAWNGSEFGILSVVLDQAQTSEPTQVSFWTASGALAPQGQAAVLEPGASDQDDPCLVWIESEGAYLAAWTQTGRLRTALLAADGTVAAPSVQVFASGRGHNTPRAAVDLPGGMLVATHEQETTLRLAHSDDALAWTAHDDLVPPNRVAAPTFALAGDGSRAVVAWVSDAFMALPQLMVAVAELDAAGLVLTTQAITDGTLGHDLPAVTAGPAGQFGVAFEEARGDSDRVHFLPLPAP